MVNPFQSRFDAATARAEAWLRTRGFTTIGENTSGSFRRRYALSHAIAGRSYSLELLLPRRYPVAPPRLRVRPAEEFYGKVPHVERDGMLCLFNSGTEYNTAAVEAVLDEVLGRAEKVLGLPDQEDFYREVQSYWPDLREELYSLHLVGEISGGAKTLSALLTKTKSYVGSDAKAITSWVNHWLVKKKGTQQNVREIPVLHLPGPLRPAEFPRTLSDLIALAQNHDASVSAAIAEHCCTGLGDGLVVICFPYLDKDIVLGARYPALRLGFQKRIYAGFRPGKIPGNLAVSRGHSELAGTEIIRLRTSLGTHEYVHSRGGAGQPFKEKTVVAVGCGSLGGYLAHQLAKGGVGRLHLIDPQHLDWENPGRHLLGAGEVGAAKAVALAEHLLKQLPHLDIVSHSETWTSVWQTTPKVFLEADLVISSLGHWNDEHDLNVLARRVTGFPAVLFGWIEAHAAAGHGLLVHPQLGGCLGCGSSATGEFTERVCKIMADTMQQGAGCGDFYQPYGVTEMLPSAAMIAQLAMDFLLGKVPQSELRTWTSAASLFSMHNLTVREQWRAKLIASPFGTVHHLTWPVAPSCPYCH